MALGKSTTLKSSMVRLGRRTLFFDVKKSEGNKKFLKITESRFMGEGKERVYNSIVLFPDGVDVFRQAFENMSSLLGK